eukprot:CAMPEP_0183555578 /NCGR_PEP_ID=MMETSP0371-20130417/79805_1 /TAXON_ID=268820 /ORGANISM="Peridinium aciculiferum, Strain PAER-2" /LENGTH=188 /DNA_ID=CAMNT_0025761815 /DNA_START=371 /DNA_END=937 /DNA_ORIENTATION=-
MGPTNHSLLKTSSNSLPRVPRKTAAAQAAPTKGANMKTNHAPKDGLIVELLLAVVREVHAHGHRRVERALVEAAASQSAADNRAADGEAEVLVRRVIGGACRKHDPAQGHAEEPLELEAGAERLVHPVVVAEARLRACKGHEARDNAAQKRAAMYSAAFRGPILSRRLKSTANVTAGFKKPPDTAPKV